jgi:hypothetical protein
MTKNFFTAGCQGNSEIKFGISSGTLRKTVATQVSLISYVLAGLNQHTRNEHSYAGYKFNVSGRARYLSCLIYFLILLTYRFYTLVEEYFLNFKFLVYFICILLQDYTVS